MKYFISLLILLPLVSADDLLPSTFSGNCAKCVTYNSTWFYCSKTAVCSNVTIDDQSCEQGLSTCLIYNSVDLGIKEIPPFTTVKSSFNYTITQNKTVRFAISNQDSKTKGWFKLMLKTASYDENG